MKLCCLKALDIPHEVTIPVLPCWTESVRVDQRPDYRKELLKNDQNSLDLLDHDPSVARLGDTQGPPLVPNTLTAAQLPNLPVLY